MSTRAFVLFVGAALVAAIGGGVVEVRAATPPVAHVVSLTGTAEAQSPGEAYRALEDGASLFTGDHIRTGSRARVEFRFVDETKFEVGPRASMNIDEFSYDPEVAERNTFSAKVFRGVFRFVTGLVAKQRPTAMSVNLPVATIGIRGTHVMGEAKATSATVIMAEPETPEEAPSKVEVSNQYGKVTIDKPGFGTEIPDAHSPPSPVRRMKLRTIQNLMRSLQSIQRVRPPRFH